MDYRLSAAVAQDAINSWPRQCRVCLYEPLTSSHRQVFRVIDEDGRDQGMATVFLEPEIRVKTLAFRSQEEE